MYTISPLFFFFFFLVENCSTVESSMGVPVTVKVVKIMELEKKKNEWSCLLGKE